MIDTGEMLIALRRPLHSIFNKSDILLLINTTNHNADHPGVVLHVIACLGLTERAP